MKKLISVLAVLALLMTVFVFADENTSVDTVRALGIMVGDTKGDMNLSGKVTRAQFAKMMVASSGFKDSVNKKGSDYSVYTDVPSNHWAADYIRIAAQNGWMIGYTDGSFKPNNDITLEEGCTALLRVLGYDSSTMQGSFPLAQLNKAQAIGLRDNITLVRGEKLLRSHCAELFCNMLVANTAQGKVYATSIGYTVQNGKVDYTAAIYKDMKGPFVAKAGDKLPITPSAVYLNGSKSQGVKLNQNDVYYYNENVNTAWIFTKRVSGRITALSPSATSPTSVTVAGNSYKIGSPDATFALSSLGGGATGKTVTLLLGMDDAVVGVISGGDVGSHSYGVVRDVSNTVSSDGSATVETDVSVFCTDGILRSFNVAKTNEFAVGKIVSVSVTENGVSIKLVSSSPIAGKVDISGKYFAGKPIADDAKIIDTNISGAGVKVDIADIAGIELSSANVRFYTQNADGKIDNLILNDATGDMWTYGYCITADKNGFTYLDGEKRVTVTNNASAQAGGIAVSQNGKYTTVSNLNKAVLTTFTTAAASSGNTVYKVSDSVRVYLKQGDSVYLTDANAIDSQGYNLTGYYNTTAIGSVIRVIVAEKGI